MRKKQTGEFTVRDVEKMFTSPFYTITVHPKFSLEHDPLVSKEDWVKANVKAISEVGAEKWLYTLLETLEEDDVPFGYQIGTEER